MPFRETLFIIANLSNEFKSFSWMIEWRISSELSYARLEIFQLRSNWNFEDKWMFYIQISLDNRLFSKSSGIVLNYPSQHFSSPASLMSLGKCTYCCKNWLKFLTTLTQKNNCHLFREEEPIPTSGHIYLKYAQLKTLNSQNKILSCDPFSSTLSLFHQHQQLKSNHQIVTLCFTVLMV